jgi:hypothetical protein
MKNQSDCNGYGDGRILSKKNRNFCFNFFHQIIKFLANQKKKKKKQSIKSFRPLDYLEGDTASKGYLIKTNLKKTQSLNNNNIHHLARNFNKISICTVEYRMPLPLSRYSLAERIISFFLLLKQKNV